MSDVHFRNDFTVELIDCMGDDRNIVRAARVSTVGKNDPADNAAGLINFLMKNRHGSPFEHGAITYYIEAPIFVWREFMRHRIGFSYNETSGRYRELEPVFYVPPAHRPLVQVGKPGHYTFEQGDQLMQDDVRDALRHISKRAFDQYRALIDRGVAKEVARMVLPVNLFSSAYVTCNPRSMMSFLSLRTKDEDSTFQSFPQWEIEQVAREMEGHFADLFAETWRAFNRNGRVSP